MLNPDQAEESVLNALKDGYKLIDTANAYVNEKGVGRGIKKSGVKREDIFSETKLWPAFYEEENQVEKTLKRLDTDYIDLLLLHQPCGNYIKGYKIMEKAVKEGKVKTICTSTSSGLGQSGKLLEREANGGNLEDGHRFKSNPTDDDINDWIDSIK